MCLLKINPVAWNVSFSFCDGTQSLRRRSVPAQVPLLTPRRDKLQDFKWAFAPRSRGKVSGATSPASQVNGDRKTLVNSCSTRAWCERVRVITALWPLSGSGSDSRCLSFLLQYAHGERLTVSLQDFKILFPWKPFFLYLFFLSLVFMAADKSNAWIHFIYVIGIHDETIAPAQKG